MRALRGLKINYAWIILIGGIFMHCGVTGLLYNSAGLFLPPVAESMGVKLGDLSLSLTFMKFASAAVMPLVGRWIGAKNINALLSVMICLYVGAYIWQAAFTQLWQWYVSSAVIGFAGAFLWFTPIPMMIRNWFKKKTGLAVGIVTASSGVVAALVSPVQTRMVELLGWRQTYVIIGIAALLLSLPPALFVFKFKPSDIGLKAYGEPEGETAAEAAADMAAGMSFYRASKSGVLALIMIFISFVAISGSFCQHLTAFSRSVGLSYALAGYVYSTGMLGNTGAKLLVGALNDKFGVKAAYTVSAALISASFVLMLFAGANAPLLIAAGFLNGFAMADINVIPVLYVNRMVGGRNFPKIFAYAQIGSMAVGGVGVGLIGKAYDLTHGYAPQLWAILAFTLASVPLMAYSLRRAKQVGFDRKAAAFR